MPRLPPVVAEIERKIMYAIRDSINVGYRDLECPFYEHQKILRSLLTETSTLVKPLELTVFESAKLVREASNLFALG